METMNELKAGQEVIGEPLDNRLPPPKSAKKKKSIPRLFLLSRAKSTKSIPPSPVILPEISSPSLSNQHSPLRISPSSFKADLSKSSGNRSEGKESVLKESSGNILRNLDHSPRDMTDTWGNSTDTLLDSVQYNQNGEPAVNGSKTRSPKARTEHSRTSHHITDEKRSQRPPRLPMKSSMVLRDRVASTSHHPTHIQSDVDLPLRPSTATHCEFPEAYLDTIQRPPLPVASAPHAKSEGKIPQRPKTSNEWNPWSGPFSRDHLRDSSRSGLSTESSLLDTGSTEQSSIFTKMSSTSDMTVDFEEDESPRTRSMTVDDAIQLYSAGFDGDFGIGDGHTPRSGNSAEIRRRSVKIAEAMNDCMDSLMLTSPEPVVLEPESKSSVTIMSGGAFRNIFPNPPSIQQPTNTHDQYGFRKSSRDINHTQYDVWQTGYVEIQDRRTNKWIIFMKDQGLSTQDPTRFPQRSIKTQRFIRKGIPPAWRGEAWFFYAGGEAYLNKHPDLYARLVLLSQTPRLSANDKESVERDINRTFPDNLHFKPDPPLTPTSETSLLSSLRRVLCAFAVHHPRIGYCQSLNFLAGLLLLFLPEEKAFWMLHIITTSYLPGTHDISLEGANVDLWVLMLALKEAVPSIWAKVGGEVNATAQRLPPVSLCTTSWFMSLFIGTLPIESVLRVWDVLFYEGSKTLFRVALAIFKLGETEIRNVSDPMEIFQVVQGLPRKMLEVGALLDVACGRGLVSQAWLEKKRKERREWYAKERAVEKVCKESRDSGRKLSKSTERNDSAPAGTTELLDDEELSLATTRSRADTGWRTRFGLGRRTD
ncbi:MAG: hypothetical protein Q9187_005782 [Circinaria calcarea]